MHGAPICRQDIAAEEIASVPGNRVFGLESAPFTNPNGIAQITSGWWMLPTDPTPMPLSARSAALRDKSGAGRFSRGVAEVAEKLFRFNRNDTFAGVS